jgi:hypothetical protein
LLLFQVGASSKYLSIPDRRSVEVSGMKDGLEGVTLDIVGLVGFECTRESIVSAFFLYFARFQ